MLVLWHDLEFYSKKSILSWAGKLTYARLKLFGVLYAINLF